MPFLNGFGSHVPARIVTNAELARRLNVEASWIEEMSGIQERRYSDGETVVDLGVAAARNCLAASDRTDVGMVITASGTPGRRFPGPASGIARELGLGQIPAVDLPIASAGAVFGVALASQLTRQYGSVLVVASEKMSAVAAEQGVAPSTAMLFGDGAGACVVSDRGGLAEIEDSVLASDGSFDAALQLGASSPLEMDGRTIILQAARKIPQSITQLLGRAGVTAADVSAYLLHQANQNLMNQVARALQVPQERVFSNIRRYGNTSSASVLIAAAEWNATAGFRRGERVVLSAFGAGLHWGSILLKGQ